MHKSRLEAFSDGVIAIILTIMVLELKVPQGTALADLRPLLPLFLSYVLSFVYIGIYWNNHHHLLHAMRQVSGRVLWANLSLLFWLSLLPFAAGWMGENHFAALPTAFYGVILECAALSYYILQLAIVATDGPNSVLKAALGADWKGKTSLALNLIGIAVAMWSQAVAQTMYVLVALMWLVPDPRIERILAGAPEGHR